MKKETIRWGIGLLVLLLLYILVAFLIPFRHTAVFWVSFLFTLVAYGVVGFSLYTAFVKAPNAKSKFYGFPIAKIGVIYGGVQLVIGLIFMALGVWVPVWLVVLLYAVTLGAAVIGLISADAVVEEIHVQDEKLKKDVSFMRAQQSKVNQLASQCALPELRQFAEDIRFSDPVSSPALEEIQRDLAAAIDDLEAAILDGNPEIIRTLCQKATAILGERNRLCKLNK